MNKKQKQQVIAALGIAHLTKIHQDKIIDALMKNVAAKVNLAAWDILKDSDINYLKNQKNMLAYIHEKIDNFPALVAQITRDVITEFKKIRAETYN